MEGEPTNNRHSEIENEPAEISAVREPSESQLWDLFREEARELGLPEEESVEQAKRVVERIFEKHPDLKDRIEGYKQDLLEALRRKRG